MTVDLLKQDFETMIKVYAEKIKGTKGSVFVNPDIPSKKVKTAINSYANDISEMNVVALHDGVAFGRAMDGFIITKAAFYYKELIGKPLVIPFANMKGVTLECEKIERKNQEYKLKYTLHIEMIDDEIVFPINDFYLDAEKVAGFFKAILPYIQTDQIDETDKIMILEDMPNEVKLNYVKAIAQFIDEAHGEIGGETLSEIQTLMAQLDFDVTLRHEIRAYITELDQEIESLIGLMTANVPRGSEGALRVSLVKDMIRVYRVLNDEAVAKKIPSLKRLAEEFNIKEEQIDVIEEGIKNDEKIMRGEVKDDQIIKNAKDLSSKAAAVGVPIAAIYMSGSVVGLSAAGLTSGLAALGLGGVLGLSSMVTGIGVVVLGGVGVYKGIQWATGGSERSKTTKREFFIQEIIKNNQKTINNLAEDVNHYADKVIEVALEQDVNKARLNKLGNELKMFTSALKKLQEKGVNLEEVLHSQDD